MNVYPGNLGKVFIAGHTDVKPTTKTVVQSLFEEVRHVVSSKHKVPAHLTEMELKFILNLLKQPEDRE